MDLSLTDEQQAFRSLAREFLDREAVPHRAQWDRDESVDLAILPKMAELGFFGLTIPEEYGGVGGDYLTYALAMEELGRADSSLRGIVSVSNGLVGKSILGFGTEEQKQEWLPRLASAASLGCFGLTEPDVGSDAGNLTARAVRSGSGPDSDYVINGQKLFITNGTWADLALDLRPHRRGRAQGDQRLPGADLHRGVRGPRDQGQAGAARPGDRRAVPHRRTRPLVRLLGEEGQGFTIAMSSLDKGRLGIGASCVGIVQGCLESSVDFAKERTQFGRPIAGFQLVQDMIADMSVDADAARLLVWRCADLVDRGLPFRIEASKAKLFASEAAVRAANLAIQVHGGAGYVDEYPVAEVPPRRPGDDPLRGHQPDPEAAHRAGRDGNIRFHLIRVLA